MRGTLFLLALIVLNPFSHAATSVRIMHYNAANFFDATHDQDKDDWEFLPANFPGRKEACSKKRSRFDVERCMKTDWTDEKVAIKLGQIKRLAESAKGGTPDILTLVEVENDNVVEMVAKSLGYKKWFVTSSADKRGIDVALLVRDSAMLKVIRETEHKVSPDVNSGIPTRNILEVEFDIKGERLSVFVNHWPSQAAPSQVRVNVAVELMKAVESRLKKDPSTHVVVAGDFNVTNTDRPDPFFSVVQDPANPNRLIDVDSMFRLNAKELGIKIWSIPLGTYYYSPLAQWSVLDRFFVSENLVDERGMEVDLASYEIMTRPWLVKDYAYPADNYMAGTVIKGMPMGYNHQTTDSALAGFSDHFAVFFALKIP